MAGVTMKQRKMLEEMKVEKKEVAITDLRLHWGDYTRWIDTLGHMAVITRKGKPAAAMISVETDLVMTSVATDDKRIRNRCELMELM